jgi:peroxiredoxin
MAHSPTDFLLGRRFLLASALTSFALPALADLGPDLLKGSIARMVLVKPPKPVPELAFADADDKPLKLADYKGKIVLVNFWATWCAPCQTEYPQLLESYLWYRSRDLEFVSVSVDAPGEKAKVERFLNKTHSAITNLQVDTDDVYAVMKAFDPSWESGVPFTMLIAPGGQVIYSHQGEVDSIRFAAESLNGNALRTQHVVLQGIHRGGRLIDGAHKCQRARQDGGQQRAILQPRLGILVLQHQNRFGGIDGQQLSCGELMVEPVDTAILQIGERVVPCRAR